MKILAIIPARGGSKGVPGKNIKLLGGQPLLAYTLDQAHASGAFTKIIVSTEDAEIAAVAQSLGAAVPFIRPTELATDTASSIAVVQHAVQYLKNQGETFDAICLLQPTTPFRAPDLIAKCVKTLLDGDFDAVVSVLPVPHEYNPHWVFVPNEQGALQIATGAKTIIKRRQDLPDAYFRDGAVYLTRAQWIEQGSFYGEKLGFVVADATDYVNIDTLSDWEKAEQIVQLKEKN